jgi:hypothetical protein
MNATQTAPVMKTFSHTVYIPPLTDQEQMGGVYKALFNSLGIKNDIPFPEVGAFTHPIEEENQKMTAEYMQTMQLLQTSTLVHGGLELASMRFQATVLLFTFSYKE